MLALVPWRARGNKAEDDTASTDGGSSGGASDGGPVTGGGADGGGTGAGGGSGLSPGAMPDVRLPDFNPDSPPDRDPVSPRDDLERVSDGYFTHARWTCCRGRVGRLDILQDDLEISHPEQGIRLIVVDESGLAPGLGGLVSITALPVLPDDAAAGVGDLRGLAWRNLRVPNPENDVHAGLNLTDHDLGEDENHEALKALPIEAAGG